MKGVLSACLVAIVAVGASAAPAPVRTPAAPVMPSTTFDARLQDAARAIDDGRYPAALALVASAEASGTLEDREADWAAYLKSRALVASGDVTQAEKTIRERQRAHPNAYNWSSLVSILAACGKPEEAARAILSLDDAEFILVNRLRHGLVENILNALETSGSALQAELVARLVEGRYTGPASQHTPDTLRLRHVGLLVRRNLVERAARETQKLESPTVLTLLLADAAFSPLWSMPAVRQLLAPGALVARVERGVQARLEQPHLTSSDWLELMRSLRAIGKPEEAVRLGLHAIEQARHENRAVAVSLRLEVAQAYADMGEAWAARRTAKEMLKEQAALPIPLRLQIADLLEITEDDEGALLMLGTISGVEAFPLALKVAACAAHDLGRFARRDAALAQLEALADTAPLELMGASLCTGNMPRAATLLGTLFDTPALRPTAVLAVQLYDDHSRAGSDLRDLRYRQRALVAAEATQVAIAGRARSLGLPFTAAAGR